jgi:anti-sigma regulatory factor (Ser/Thr protein kinase)
MTMTAIRHTATDVPRYSETLPREKASATRARGLVAAVLLTWRLDNLIDDASLITAELVNNAVLHGRGSVILLGIERRSDGTVRIAVSDRSHDLPQMHHPNEDEYSGRGLLLVDALARRWDTDQRRWGKVVWAELNEPLAPGSSSPVRDA